MTPHFNENEFHKGRGWAIPGLEGESHQRYMGLALYSLEPLREAFAKPITVLSGERTVQTNGGKPSSCHLPPGQRKDPTKRALIGNYKTSIRPELSKLHSAAADIRVSGSDPIEVYHVIYEAMRLKFLPPGGVFYYKKQQFVHIDNRGFISRDVSLMPTDLELRALNTQRIQEILERIKNHVS